MKPSIGRIVHYTLNQQDADEINRRRADFAAHVKSGALRDDGTGYVAHVGNQAREGDVYPAMIARVFGETPESAVNLQVVLDGNDTLWATSRTVGEGPSHWAWPERV
ncbi:MULTISPECIES: hypothetical protein [unclassified Streptomyces]|uniref:hypothetical protein n=1 Tax=unclassified Streptomyces TaxID=2593676 RepID=UPI0036ED8F62